MTIAGDLYYENKEYEIKFQTHFKPGKLSDKIRQALGMPPGAPPPWLINMQKHGLPPSYPKLRMPGLNAPIPEGAQYGYHPGGWGRLPVDAFNRPLYNDFFITETEKNSDLQKEKQDDMFKAAHVKHWGEVEDGPEEEEETEVEVVAEPEPVQEKKEKPKPKPVPQQQPPAPQPVAAPVPKVETPDSIDLRKKPTEAPKVLYQILEEKQTSVGGGIMGSTHRYVIPGSNDQDQEEEEQRTDEKETEDDSKKRKRKEDKKSKEKKKKFKF
jgi:splicing factor 3B subunit 2